MAAHFAVPCYSIGITVVCAFVFLQLDPKQMV